MVMISPKQLEKVRFGGPSKYRILVKGDLTHRNMDDLKGMGILITERDIESALTQLDGTLSDQAALSGLLETLYETHLSIVSVEVLTEDEDTG
jgi:hypothetical protein